ncbi:MAG: LLM class flavin-dependent oxidoreductase [Solirubrobacteraceae bacterium]|nr:LLM class flavin-dependent oxidoreductase [Solirubrobacteraceae bacterium]
MELGLVTFADIYRDRDSGRMVTPRERMSQLLEEVRLADEVGLDVFGIGEHHRPDYLVSSPTTALAAAAAVTERIRLSSAVSVLSSEDPVRLFQQFSTVDLVSGGRAEIMAGRGSFTESYPLFGQDLKDYDELFAEKLDLLLRLREDDPVTWSGKHRAALDGVVVHPRPAQSPLPVGIAVGGTPQSVARAGLLGLPLTIAIIGGTWGAFEPLTDLYRRAVAEGGHEMTARHGVAEGARESDHAAPAIAINTHGFVGSSEKEAVEAFFPAWSEMMTRIGRERGWPPTTRAQFDAMRRPEGALMVGEPDQVVEKILAQRETLGIERYLGHFSLGSARHADVMRSIELFGTEVAPKVRAEVARREAPVAAGA